MNYKKYFTDWRYLTILSLSLLSIIPLVFFVYNIESLAKIADIKVVNEALIKDTLSKDISKFSVWFPFVIGVVIWFTNAVLSAVMLHKKQVKSLYAYSSLILGGLGIHLVILLMIPLFEKKKDLIKINRRTSLIFSVSTLGLLSMAAFIPFIAVNATTQPDTPVIGNPIEVSLDENNPNLIEVFTDGFDRGVQRENMEGDANFKDFTYFNRFMTVAGVTHRSLPVLWGGKEYNQFGILSKEPSKTPIDLQTLAYGKYFLETGAKHLRMTEQDFSQKSVVNTISWSNNPGYAQVSSGTAAAIKNDYPDINLTNWAGARDSVFGKWGVSNLSPDRVSYKWLSNNFKVTNNAKGARVLTNDLMTHRPFLLGDDGKFTFNNYSEITQANNLKDSLSELISKLKAITKVKNDGSIISAYDNSMIVFYGDHSNHGIVANEGSDIKNTLRHSESLLMIKYPHKTFNALNVVNDRYLYSSELNGIIKHYFNHKNEEPLDYFKDAKFNNVPRPIFCADNQYVMAQWQDATNISPKLGQKIAPIGEPINWDANNRDKSAHDVTALMED